jgi:hypothetical protein
MERCDEISAYNNNRREQTGRTLAAPHPYSWNRACTRMQRRRTKTARMVAQLDKTMQWLSLAL